MSTCVADYQYDKKSKELTIQFVKGGSYTYHEVPQRVVTNLKKAGSQGQYFNAFIRNQYG